MLSRVALSCLSISSFPNFMDSLQANLSISIKVAMAHASCFLVLRVLWQENVDYEARCLDTSLEQESNI